MNNDFIEKLSIIADILQIFNFIDNEKQSKQLEEVYNYIHKLDNDIMYIKEKLDLISTFSKINVDK